MIAKEYLKEWGLRNQDKIKSYRQNIKHKKKAVERTVKGQRDNPEKHAVKKLRYLATEKGKKSRKANRNYRRERTKICSLGNIWEMETLAIYKNCQDLNSDGIRWEVDHVIPLLGRDVSGLHVPWNLRIVPKEENRMKTNKLLKDSPL